MNERPQIRRAEILPLTGRRIVITRARLQASSLARAIEAAGGAVLEFPTIEILPPENLAPLEDAVRNLDRYQWLIFTSVNGVERFLETMTRLGQDPARLASVSMAAIGPETAKRLEAAGVASCLVPESYRAEGILEILPPDTMRGARVLVPRAQKAREVLPDTLRAWGAKVDVVEAYRTAMPPTETSALSKLLERGEIDMVAFTSSSTVVNFARIFGDRRLADVLGSTAIACIGPITRDTVEALGGVATVVAEEFTAAGLVRAMVDHFSREPDGGTPGA